MDIQTLNDNFRKSLLGGKVMLTRGVFSKGQKAINKILDSVKMFNDFNSCGRLIITIGIYNTIPKILQI